MSALNDFTELPREPDLRHLLKDGVAYWNGPLQPADEVAALMDFRDADEMAVRMLSLEEALRAGQAVTMRDVMRALLATELAWASVVVGDPTDWWNITGRSDSATLTLLRQVQDTLSDGGAPLRYLHPFAR